MAQETITDQGTRHFFGRAANWLTDRRAFLSGASKYGALLMSAAYLPSIAVVGRAGGFTQAPASANDDDTVPVEEKGFIRLLGVVQRRPGLTKMEVKFRSAAFDLTPADRAFVDGVTSDPRVNRQSRPTAVNTYYQWVYTQLTKNQPGKRLGTYGTNNVAIDSAFGVDLEQCAALVNRDLVWEYSFEREGQKPAASRPEPTPPDSLDVSSALNLVAQQVFAQGTRPDDPDGTQAKAMHFMKLSSGAAADPIKTWQALHGQAMTAAATLGEHLQGHELLQRLPDTPARQTFRCGGDVPVPDLVSCFWSKTADRMAPFQAAFAGYVRALRQADKAGAIDHANSFFLIIEEYGRTN